MDGVTYSLDISAITLTDIPIEPGKTDVSIDEALTSNLTSEEVQDVEKAAASVTGEVKSIITDPDASKELAEAGKDALDKVGEGTDVKVMVYMKVKATGYTVPGKQRRPSLKLDITPVYKVVKDDKMNPEEEIVIGETELRTKRFETKIKIEITLPSGFVKDVSSHVVAKHYNQDGQ